MSAQADGRNCDPERELAAQQTREREKREKEDRKENEEDKKKLKELKSSWRVGITKRRPVIQAMMYNRSIWAAVFGCLGLASVVLQNELLIDGTSPMSAGVILLKLFNTFMTGLCLASIFHVYWYGELSTRLDAHLRSKTEEGETFDHALVGMTDAILHSKFFWGEVLICAAHLPPGCTFEAGVQVMGNFVLYRGELMDLLVETLRLYLVARVLWQWVLSDLPKLHAVSLFFPHTSLGPMFALKRLLTGWSAILFISFLWMSVIVIYGYLFRLSEATACLFDHAAEHGGCNNPDASQWSLDSGASYFDKTNDYYLSNSLWVMFITSTTVGYGDSYATTHLGRMVSVFTALAGILLVSVLTASLGSIVVFTSPEYSALRTMEGVKCKDEAKEQASKVIAGFIREASAWWRTHQPSTDPARKTKVKFSPRLRKYLQAFMDRIREAKELSNMEGVASVEEKVHHVGRQVASLESSASDLCKALRVNADVQTTLSNMRIGPSNQQASVTGIAGFMMSVNARSARDLLRVPGNNAPDPATKKDWRTSKTEVQAKMVRAAQVLAGCALGGTLCAWIENELVLADGDPKSAAQTFFKALNLLLSALCCPCIFRIHALSVLLQRLLNSRGIVRLSSLRVDVSWREVLAEKNFWLETLVCGLHLPPGVTFEVGSYQGPNYVVYRAETIFFLVNSLRLYVLARVIKDWCLASLPHAHSIAAIHRVRAGYRFSAKQTLNGDNAAVYILFAWLFCICLTALWVRATEYPACDLTHSEHEGCDKTAARIWTLWGSEVGRDGFRDYHNAWWCMFITGTTVGYGDFYPVTHLGRVCAAVSAITGAFATSLLTAALMAKLTRTSDEETAFNVLLRQRAVARVKTVAVKLIQTWWRQLRIRLGRQSVLQSVLRGGVALVSFGRAGQKSWQDERTMRHFFQELRTYQALAAQSPEDTASTEMRIDHTLSALHKLEAQLHLCVAAVKSHPAFATLASETAIPRSEGGNDPIPIPIPPMQPAQWQEAFPALLQERLHSQLQDDLHSQHNSPRAAQDGARRRSEHEQEHGILRAPDAPDALDILHDSSLLGHALSISLTDAVGQPPAHLDAQHARRKEPSDSFLAPPPPLPMSPQPLATSLSIAPEPVPPSVTPSEWTEAATGDKNAPVTVGAWRGHSPVASVESLPSGRSRAGQPSVHGMLSFDHTALPDSTSPDKPDEASPSMPPNPLASGPPRPRDAAVASRPPSLPALRPSGPPASHGGGFMV